MRRKSENISDTEKLAWAKETAADAPLKQAIKSSKTPIADADADADADSFITDLPENFSQSNEKQTAILAKPPRLNPLIPGNLKHLEPKRAKQFTRAQSKRDASLDLHGLTQNIAYDLVCKFIENAHRNQKRNLRIITGKGAGILQTQLLHWLNAPRLRSKIIAVNYAAPREGGAGALVVLLKRL
jgi:DNA-nicking Smr family endonuclease